MRREKFDFSIPVVVKRKLPVF